MSGKWNDLDWTNIDPYDARYYQQIYDAAKERQVEQPFTPGAEMPTYYADPIFYRFWQDEPRGVPKEHDILNTNILKRLTEYVYYSAYQYIVPDHPFGYLAPFAKVNQDPCYWDYHAEIMRAPKPVAGTTDPKQTINYLIYLKDVVQSIRLLSIHRSVRMNYYKREWGQGVGGEERWTREGQTAQELIDAYHTKPITPPESFHYVNGITYSTYDDPNTYASMKIRCNGSVRFNNYRYMHFEATDCKWTNGFPFDADIYMDVVQVGEFSAHYTGLTTGRHFYRTVKSGESIDSLLQELLDGPVTGNFPPGIYPIYNEDHTYGISIRLFADLGPYFNYKDKANEEPYPPGAG